MFTLRSVGLAWLNFNLCGVCIGSDMSLYSCESWYGFPRRVFDYSVEFAWFGYFNTFGVIAMMTAFCMLPFTLYVQDDLTSEWINSWRDFIISPFNASYVFFLAIISYFFQINLATLTFLLFIALIRVSYSSCFRMWYPMLELLRVWCVVYFWFMMRL